MGETVRLAAIGPDREAGFETTCRNMVDGESTVGWKTLNKIRP